MTAITPTPLGEGKSTVSLGHHGQVMCVHDIVDIAGETQGELGHGHEQGVAAAGRSTLAAIRTAT